MLVTIPILAFAIFVLTLLKRRMEWRRALMVAAVFWGSSVVAITETLSAFRLVSRWPLAIGWLIVCIVGVYIPKVLPVSFRTAAKQRCDETLDPVVRKLMIATIGLVLIVGGLALIAAPNVWDAMEYHLPRASMWMGNQSVGLYATPDYAQLIFGPWAEFAMMHTELLWGSDRFVNLIEFISFVFSAIGVSLIAERLGASRSGQAFAAVACVTIPQGLLEASGPMNTYVVSFWIIAAVLFILLWNEEGSRLNTTCIGLAGGLALFTKGTAYVVLPFLVLACWWMGSRGRRIEFIRRSIVFVLLIVAINAAQYRRSYELTGSPLGFPLTAKYPRLQIVVEHVTPSGTLAGLLRNVALHVVTPSERVNAIVDKAFHSGISIIGVNPDASGQVYLDEPFHSNHFSLHEIHAGNPLHLLLILIALLSVLWMWKKAGANQPGWYAVGLVLAAVMFSALLRWTQWSSRYQLPLFVVGAPLVGLLLDRYLHRKAALAVTAILVISSVPFVISNRTRSLVPWSRVESVYHPRAYQYFLDSHTEIALPNIAAANFVNRLQCDQIALDPYLSNPVLALTPRSMYVYPMLALIHADGGKRTAWYSGVQNDTVRFNSARIPCAVICFDCASVREKWQEYRNIGGRASVFDYIVVFSREGATPNIGAEQQTGLPPS